MTLQQTLKSAPARTNELLVKLADTSNNAVKTREKLLGELSSELTLYIGLEDQHLMRVLRKHDETKGLAGDATKGARALRARLAELEAAPKDGDAFLERLGALTKDFQQHVRTEGKELLPLLSKVLNSEEASALAADIEAGITAAEAARREEASRAREAQEAEKRQRDEAAAAAETARREEARQARDAAKRQREAEEAAAEAERVAVRAQKQLARNAREAVDQTANVVRIEAEATQEVGRRITETVSGTIEQATTSASQALDTYRRSAHDTAGVLKAVTEASTVTRTGLSEIGSAWSEWASKAARTNVEMTQRLLGCRSLQQLAEVQSEFGNTVARNWMEANVRVLQAVQQTARQALKPLDRRLEAGD